MDFELIGILASSIVLCSALFKSTDIKKNILMRFINMVGSLTFVIYGILIGSISVALLNAIMVIVGGFHAFVLIKELKTKKNETSFSIFSVDSWANRSDDPKHSNIKYGVFGVDWFGSPGWGRWEMIFDEKGVPHIYSEHMDKGDHKEFSKAILDKVLDIAIVEE